MSDETEVSALLQLIEPVIAPLPEDGRAIMMDLIKYELENRPIVAFLMDRPRAVYEEQPVDAENPDGPKHWIPVEKVNVWTLGGKSPIDPDATIFAMLMAKDRSFVTVWSFSTVTVGDKEGLRYWREVVRDYTIAQGPSAAKAMVFDFEEMIADEEDDPEPEPEPKKTNGAPARP